jgi:hypothetical protein
VLARGRRGFRRNDRRSRPNGISNAMFRAAGLGLVEMSCRLPAGAHDSEQSIQAL